jgi:hypothetical protein
LAAANALQPSSRFRLCCGRLDFAVEPLQDGFARDFAQVDHLGAAAAMRVMSVMPISSRSRDDRLAQLLAVIVAA